MAPQHTGLATGGPYPRPGPRPPGSGAEQFEEALLGGPRRYSRAEVAAAAGVSLDRCRRIWLAL
jgi:adenylate cyclase